VDNPVDRERIAAAQLPVGSLGKNSAGQSKRYCDLCGTWLAYRTEGPLGAFATYSYCPDASCVATGKIVEKVHVS